MMLAAIRSMRVWVILISICFFGGCGHRHSVAPGAFLAPPPSEARGSLAVMTVNLQHRDRPDEMQAVATQLRADPQHLPDFVLCQEVLFGRSAGEGSTAEVLARQMRYDVRGTRRSSDREGIAILSRYPIDFYDAIELRSQTSPLLLGFRRVSTMAETTVPGIGRVRLVNVHFTNWGFEAHVRRAQLRETLQWAARRDQQAPAAVTFLAGDFNATRGDNEMNLVKDTVLTAPLKFEDWNTTEPSHDSNRRIDHIFVSARQAVQLSSERLLWKQGVPRDGRTFTLSDHLPVVHQYQFPTPALGGVGSIRE